LAAPLLTTKFYIPPPPPGDLTRPRLFSLLDEVLSESKRLGLVCAPAGYGKTTLVADWIRTLKAHSYQLPVAVAWLSLEESENDPQQFLLYLIESLQRALGSDAEIALLAQSIPASTPQAILSRLVNLLSAQPGTLLLVLDDYQAIRSPEIHNNLAFLIEHLPPSAHLIITTRSDPSLPLHRYRARGQVAEVRLDELRLNAHEVSTLLSQENRTDLGPTEANILADRTEGWPAGVHMAILSLRGKPNASEYIHTWSGNQRYILDYLAEEVLKNQPPVVQQFLVQTAVLDRLCAPLCEEMIGSQLPVESELSTTQLLDSLYRSNLFLIPLDEEHQWFRYHHLFLDLLRVRLKQLSQKTVAGLHRRAAGWLEANGWLREAIQHYIQAGDFEAAARLVEEHTLRLFSEGELQSLLAWIRLLPENVAASRPWLRIYQGWALGFAGRLPEAWQMCQAVEEMLGGEEIAEIQRHRLRAELYGIRALTGLMAGKINEVLALETLPEELLQPGAEFARSAVAWALGYAWRMQGRLAKALAAFEEMQQLGLKINNHWTVISSAVDLGMTLRLMGRLRDAESAYRNGLERVHQAGMGGMGFVGRLESFLAYTLFEKNELEAAEKFALSSIHHNRYWVNPNHTAHAMGMLARIYLAKGEQQYNLPTAEQALREASQAAEDPGVVATLKTMLEVLRLKLWLAQNDLAQVRYWLEAHQPAIPDPAYLQTEMGQMLGIACARAHLVLDDQAGALALLSQVETAARQAGQINTLIEIRAIQAHASRDPLTRRTALLEALSLGCPQGYSRTFLDEGEALRQELSAALAWLKRERATAADTPHLTAWIDSLLGQFPNPVQAESAQPIASPLTGREMEILRGMAEGLSNQEIGKRLYISAGTVKAHSAAIYRKLDVANRTEAIAKAKDMGLI
jgi:LuxR family transcriptional regulator, maltose regulon positive regulatory protein